MSFFTYFYLENRMYFQDYIKYILIFVALIALFLVASQYLRHRLQNKYRDLSIIFLLLIIFLLGVQYIQYQRSQNYADDTSRMVSFLNSVIHAQNVKKEEILVNSQTLSNGMILGIQGNFYSVEFNREFSAYSLMPINLVNPEINIVQEQK